MEIKDIVSDIIFGDYSPEIQLDSLRRILSNIDANRRIYYVEEFAPMAACVVDSNPQLLDFCYDLGARNIDEMTLFALQHKDSSIAFSKWLLLREDINLIPSVNHFISLNMVNTANYLMELPLDGRNNAYSYITGLE